MSFALRVENISKQYRIYGRPSHRLTETVTRGRLKRHREFWALRGVTFDVKKGETVGIVGVNGSGKSTLLQIITGTLTPTHGTITHDGRVAALLELGAGFNLEFTGVENVFMNAALMGFTRRETEKILPDIERFAEIGDFIQQPVKTYSSGMFVRLAFAVAISVNPDLLIIDEALSVGDAVFQLRCLRRIKQMQEQGTTILFVSHDPSAVKALCSRAILLNGGCLIADGEPHEVLNVYQKLLMEREEEFDARESTAHIEEADAQPGDATLNSETSFVLANLPPVPHTFRHGDGGAEILSAEILTARRESAELVESGETLTARLRVRFQREIDAPVFGFLIRNRHGINVYGANTEQQGEHFGTVRRGAVFEINFAFDCWLGTDLYSVTFAVHNADGVSYDWLDGVAFFRVASARPLEGIANLRATVNARVLHSHVGTVENIPQPGDHGIIVTT